VLNGTTEVAPFPCGLSLDEVATSSDKVKGSGQECPLHNGLGSHATAKAPVAEAELIGACLRPSELGAFAVFLERFHSSR
jgi:hypothetical protein